MSSKKILQLSKYYYPTMGGIELVAKMISRAHVDLGDTVNILSFGENVSKYDGPYKEKVTQVRSNVVLMSAPINYNLIFEFKQYVIDHEIEKIYVHLPNPFMHHLLWIFRRFLKKKNIKLSAVYHSDIVNQKILGYFYDIYFKLTSGIYDEVICSSEKLWKSSKVLSVFSDNKMKVIPFCVDTENELNVRKKFTGKLLAIGRLVPYKGFRFLMESLKGSDYSLNIIGDGPLKEELEQFEDENIKLVGKVSDEYKEKLIDESDILVVPSINRSEAYGMIIVEAFSSGMPVIASNINSGVTFLADDTRGRVFETLSKESLLSSLEYFKENPNRLEESSVNCRAFYDKHLSYDRFKEKIANLSH
jgi:glycosyltransferase involved in cell wall biosynthesis